MRYAPSTIRPERRSIAVAAIPGARPILVQGWLVGAAISMCMWAGIVKLAIS